jgi:aminoglycoside 6-adenylyltransferase
MQEKTTQLLTRITRWAESNANVIALVMTGSHVREGAAPDKYSDLDLEIIAEQPELLSGDNTWIEGLGAVWVKQFFNEGQPYPTRLVLYEGGTKVDFTLAGRDRIVDMQKGLDPLYKRGYRVLIDKKEITIGLPPSTGEFPIKEPPSQREFDEVVNEFWFEAAHIPRYLVRDELWVVKFRDWTMKENLLKMIEWHAIAHRSDPVDVWYIGSHMKEWVDPAIWQELNEVFSHFDKQDSWRGLMKTTDLFGRLARETANQTGLDYASKVEAALSGYIKSFAEEI